MVNIVKNSSKSSVNCLRNVLYFFICEEAQKMARILKNKELVNTKLATNYGGWMYCEACEENIGYLCYSTYDRIELNYVCQCGSKGSAFLDFQDSHEGSDSQNELVIVKNRLCCPKDKEPLITILEKKLTSYELKITCKACEQIYKQERK